MPGRLGDDGKGCEGGSDTSTGESERRDPGTTPGTQCRRTVRIRQPALKPGTRSLSVTTGTAEWVTPREFEPAHPFCGFADSDDGLSDTETS